MQFRLRACLGWTFLPGLTGVVCGAESLPPLRVDPALLRPLPVAAKLESGVERVRAPVTAPLGVDAKSSVRVTAEPRNESLGVVVADAPVEPLASSGDGIPYPGLKSSVVLMPISATEGESGAVFIQADKIHGRNDVETVADGQVELRRMGSLVNADHLVYWPLEDETEASGQVRLSRSDDVIAGPHLRLKVQDNLGFFEQPDYRIKRVPKETSPLAPKREPILGVGNASRLDFEGEGLYRFKTATYSTCTPPNRDWYIEANQISLDYNEEKGKAEGATLVFKDTPILYSPWLPFSLNNQRQSGFLSPTFGSSTTSGIELTLPWYWNIAPNMDATLFPRLLSRRGVQLSSEFRYLDHAYNGTARVEYLPNDQLAGKTRSAYSIFHNQILAPGLTGNINFNGVSDYAYFADLSSRVAMVSQANLLRQGSLSYASSWWRATLTAQRYQTLQDPAAPVAVPYYRLPQLLVSAVRPDLPAGLAMNFSGEYVNFSHPTQVVGHRSVLYPQLSLPVQTAAFFVTPKLGLHMTRYNLDRQAAGVPDLVTRQVPILSVDSGVVFERDINWFGRSLTQTLEPRLYYLRVPNRNQDQIPVFDSAVIDFNFAQMFSENRYGGSDRIGDANQLTAAVVSRFIDPASGAELIRGAVGQRFYFDTQQVTLPGEVARASRKTDLLAAFSGRVLPKTFVDTGWQYSPNFHRTERFNVGGRYQPEPGKVMNASYRYTRDQIGQIDVSGQWPLGGGWYGVGRHNYSLKDRSVIESLGGLEYDGGCWVARFVLHRLATLTAQASTSFFVQLELNGLARIGSNPLEMLKRNVAGYGVINQPTTDPAFNFY
jgi:LPS-assembly protein